MEFQHTSILLNESVEFLIRNPEGVYLDCTLGGAGHSCGFAKQLTAQGMLLESRERNFGIELQDIKIIILYIQLHIILIVVVYMV